MTPSALPTQSAWLDGELCHLDADGFPDFDAVMYDVRRGDESSLFFQVWDCPWLDGRDLAYQPLLGRKERLSGLLADAAAKMRYTSHVIGNGPKVFEHASAMELEGIVSKKASSFYRDGQRNRDWTISSRSCQPSDRSSANGRTIRGGSGCDLRRRSRFGRSHIDQVEPCDMPLSSDHSEQCTSLWV